jgi:hypothetical protein
MANLKSQITKDNMVKRKFLTEGCLNLFSSGATVIQPKNIHNLSKNEEFRKALIGCNLYCIAQRKRITLANEQLKIVDGELHGYFKVQVGHDYKKFLFKCNKLLPDYIINVHASDYPGDSIHFDLNNGESPEIPIFKFMIDCEYNLENNDDLEVLYIGQAYGQEGERLAIDRLCSHETLQKILSDTLPDHEILILFFRYEHHRIIAGSIGDFAAEPIATEGEERDHFSKMINPKFNFTRKNIVSLAEAALIKYFEPKYNTIYKTNFPSLKHKVLEELIKFDLPGLVVEIDTSNIKAKLFSESVPLANIAPIDISDVTSAGEFLSILYPYNHIVKIPLNSPEEREIFLHHHL